MTKEEFTAIFTHLCLAYRKELNQSEVSVWYSYFNEYSTKLFKEAIKEIVSTNKFFPTIAEVKERIAYMTNPELHLIVEVEWESVLDAIHKYGYYRADVARKTLNEFTADIAFNSIGWTRLCDSEYIERERKLFKEIFENKQYQIANNQAMNYLEYKRNPEVIKELELYSSNIVKKMPQVEEWELK